jgi:hypothetical protein
MTMHARDTEALATLVADGRRLFGDRLVAVALYGEAASDAYRPLASPLDTAVLLDRVATNDLRLLRGRLDAWQRLRLTVPLVIDPAYLATSRDVFPLELLELRDRHRLLHGSADPFAALDAPKSLDLRRALEEQLKGKLLHLREGYVALGGAARGLEALLRATRGPLDVVLRGLLAFAERPRPARLADVIAAVETALEVPLPSFARLERWHVVGGALARPELEVAYAGLHDELAALAARIDRP